MTLPIKKIKSNADAIMVVDPTHIGFVAIGLIGGYHNAYLPTIRTVVTLLAKDHQTQIYRGYHVTGWPIEGNG